MTKDAIEKNLEDALFDRIDGKTSPELAQVAIRGSSSKAVSLADLIGDRGFTVLKDTSDWNQHKDVLVDISGGMTPDLVIRSKASNQNRIIVEVKNTAALGYGRADSQIIRYFLHLLGTTLQDAGQTDIRRAVILAAPDAWFDDAKNLADWQHFLDRYTDLARAFDITLGEIRLPFPPTG